MLSKKQGWKKPCLLVLTSTTDGEYVLEHCKTVAVHGGPSTTVDQGCSAGTIDNCSNCQSRGGGS